MNQTEICNLALLRIGSTQQIASITENSTQARACAAAYTSCVKTMLRERPWPFAIRQTTLALVGSQIFSTWLYTYRYPDSYLNVHKVNPPIVLVSQSATVYVKNDFLTLPQSYPYAIGSDSSGRLIHTNVPDAVAIGTVYVTDTAQYDPQFASALAWFIAAEIAISQTKNKDLYTNSYGQYQMVVSEAFATGANEVKPEVAPEADMVQARQ